MKFNSGAPHHSHKTEWHDWFAWYPVEIKRDPTNNGRNSVVWLERVHRIVIYPFPESSKHHTTMYRSKDQPK